MCRIKKYFYARAHPGDGNRHAFALLLGLGDRVAVLHGDLLCLDTLHILVLALADLIIIIINNNIIIIIVIAVSDLLALASGLGPVPLGHELLVLPVDLGHHVGGPQVAHLHHHHHCHYHHQHHHHNCQVTHLPLPVETLSLALQLAKLLANILKGAKNIRYYFL